MKLLLQSTALLMVMTLVNCDNDDGLSQNLMTGKIAGQEWEFQYAKAYYEPVSDQYSITFYSQYETAIDPCGINSTSAFISISLPNEETVLPLPFANEVETLKFHQPGVGQQFFVATSGLVEIISIEGRRIGGFIQASYDDDNFVEGTFIVDRCN